MVSRRIMHRLVAALFAALVFLAPVPALAAVEITFYAREFGSQFPHAFVALAGTPDRGGERIDTNYGFTATHVTPALLFGSVRGVVEAAGEGYIRNSEAHFALTITDEEYDRTMAIVTRYRELRQPSYSLNRRNCVHFIAEIAATIGMSASVPRSLSRKPNSFTELLIRDNRPWLDQRGARILREPPPPRAERRGD